MDIVRLKKSNKTPQLRVVELTKFHVCVLSAAGVQRSAEPGLHSDRGLLCRYVTAHPCVVGVKGSGVTLAFHPTAPNATQ